jgi:hypothetical protein
VLQALEFLVSFCLKFILLSFPDNKPLTFTLIDILAARSRYQNLICVRSHSEVKPAHVQRAAAGCNCRMSRSHIARHLPAPREVTPRGEHFDDPIGLIFPNESIRAVRAFLARRSRIKNDFDGIVKEVDCLITIRQKIYTL